MLGYQLFTIVYYVFLSLLIPNKNGHSSQTLIQSLQIDSVLHSMNDTPVNPVKSFVYYMHNAQCTSDDKVLYEMWPLDYNIV